MSIQAIAWAIKQRAGGATEKAVLIALANYADDKGSAFPSLGTLSEDTEIHRTTVIRAIAKLVERGLLTRTADHRANGGNTSNIYRLSMKEAEERQENTEEGGSQIATGGGRTARLGGSHSATPNRTITLTTKNLKGSKPPARAAYPPEFEEAWKAYPHHEGRSSKPKSLLAWKALPTEERLSLLTAIGRFTAKVDDACGGKGAPDMARWLRDAKHLNWSQGPPVDWPALVDLWRATGRWAAALGPPPDHPETQVPQQLRAA